MSGTRLRTGCPVRLDVGIEKLHLPLLALHDVKLVLLLHLLRLEVESASSRFVASAMLLNQEILVLEEAVFLLLL